MRKARLTVALAAVAAILGFGPAQAHHSAAVFYDANSRVTITGQVIRFNFRNPHAIVELQVKTEDGEDQRWTAETSAPSALRRRGWSQESLKPGETVTLSGLKALDGSHFMRIVSATRADGTEIGVPRGTDN
jgi:hypothetical protein